MPKKRKLGSDDASDDGLRGKRRKLDVVQYFRRIPRV